MTLPLPAGDVLQVALRALVPVAGVLFLGWPAGNVVFVYCADVLASMYVVCVLACARLFALEATEGPAWWRRSWAMAQLALMALMPWVVIAAPLAVTMVIVLVATGFDWQEALRSRGLWLGALAQFGIALQLLLRDYDALLAAPDADRAIKRRFGLVFLRWAIVLAIGWSVLAAFPDYGLVIVIACSVATAALELYPDRVLRAFGSADLATDGALGDGAAAGEGTKGRGGRGRRHRARHGRR